MPTVGGKKFPYTAKGKAAAAKARRSSAPGKPASPGKEFGMGMKGVGRKGKGKGRV